MTIYLTNWLHLKDSDWKHDFSVVSVIVTTICSSCKCNCIPRLCRFLLSISVLFGIIRIIRLIIGKNQKCLHQSALAGIAHLTLGCWAQYSTSKPLRCRQMLKVTVVSTTWEYNCRYSKYRLQIQLQIQEKSCQVYHHSVRCNQWVKYIITILWL